MFKTLGHSEGETFHLAVEALWVVIGGLLALLLGPVIIGTLKVGDQIARVHHPKAVGWWAIRPRHGTHTGDRSLAGLDDPQNRRELALCGHVQNGLFKFRK